MAGYETGTFENAEPLEPVMGEGQKKAHNPARTRTPILISAMRLLARDIQSEDGVANAAIAEAADRLEEFQEALTKIALASDDHILETDLQDIAIAALDPEVHP